MIASIFLMGSLHSEEERGREVDTSEEWRILKMGENGLQKHSRIQGLLRSSRDSSH